MRCEASCAEVAGHAPPHESLLTAHCCSLLLIVVFSWILRQNMELEIMDPFFFSTNMSEGIACGGYLEDQSISNMEMQYRINLMGSIYPVHAALPLLKPRSLAGYPTSIVFINSLCSLYFACGANTYMVSKYAQKGLAELLKVELRPWNINVQVVIPGYTETQMLDEVDKFSLQAPLWRRLFMFNREKAQSTEEVAEVIVDAMKRGNFLTTTALDGFILRILGRGLVPEDRPLYALLELLLLLPLRLISFLWVAIIHAAVRTDAAYLKAKLG